ncbi:MAG TPA: aldo/keto reductase [bacterium]|nr:aldo/keto reductase [bacterium]
MEQRPLGKTGVSVSAVGFGCGAVGGLMVRGDPAEQTAAVARALEAGITYFDTAPSYGDGRSEENLGRVLRDLGAWRHVVVGTKVRLQPADLHDPAAAIRRSCEGSLRRLERESVDLLQLHNPIAADGHGGAGDAATGSSAAIPLAIVTGSVAEGMQRLVSRGLVRHIGITGLGRTPAVHAAVRTGTFATAQVYFNAVNPSAGFPRARGGEQDFEGLIGIAEAAGMGVINIRVMAAGALAAQPTRHANAGDPGPLLADGAAYRHDLERAAAMRALAAELACQCPLELALRFALATLGISTILVGYSDRTQLEDALRWTARGPLPPEGTARVVELAR